MNHIQLIHWNPDEAKPRAEKLRDAGYSVILNVPNNIQALRKLGEDPPIAFVIDLSRLPSHGREIALVLRQYKRTRQVPLVFVEGDPEKVERTKKLLPDAVYTTWSQIVSSLKKAIMHPPLNPKVPKSIMDSYSETPLFKKLGIKANSTVVLVNAPKGFKETLGELPQGVTFHKNIGSTRDLTIWFAKSINDMESKIEQMVEDVGKGGLWIVWSKKASGVITDLSQNRVRQIGLAFGLVDYKVCSIDETWSGLLFARRKSK
jgi:CheY-like chemotaxis protein